MPQFHGCYCCCCCQVASAVSDSVRPHRWQPTRLPCPWDSPGKNTGVGCHFLLQCVKVKSLSCDQLFATPWTAAYQAPPSMGFSRQEYQSGLPLPSPSWMLVEGKKPQKQKTGSLNQRQRTSLLVSKAAARVSTFILAPVPSVPISTHQWERIQICSKREKP